MRYKLICSDLDDTLIGRDGKEGKGVKQAIKEYEERGGKFCIVTGRMTSGALPICQRLNLSGLLATFQGAVISDIKTGKVVSSTCIPCEKAVEIGRFIEEKGYYYQTYDLEKFYTQIATKYTELYAKISCANFAETGEKLSDFILHKKLSPPKILIIEKEEKIPEMLQIMRDRFGQEFLINTSKPFIIEIVAKGINKGLAMDFIAKYYGVEQSQTIAIGDSENDVTMLAYANIGACVKSGSDVAKSYADVIAPDCDDDPVSYVINSYGR